MSKHVQKRLPPLSALRSNVVAELEAKIAVLEAANADLKASLKVAMGKLIDAGDELALDHSDENILNWSRAVVDCLEE